MTVANIEVYFHTVFDQILIIKLNLSKQHFTKLHFSKLYFTKCVLFQRVPAYASSKLCEFIHFNTVDTKKNTQECNF